jgi:hypothetical protein
MTEPVTPPPADGGIVAAILDFARTITLTQALTIMLLLAVLIPSYLAYRVINDPQILNKVTSSFEEKTDENSPCTIRIYSARGYGSTWSISTGFAYHGGDRWIVAVHMDRIPDATSIAAYCEVAQRIVDHMQRPEQTPSPTYPGTDQPVIWPYPQEGSR